MHLYTYLTILIATVLALEYLHSRGVIHRDLKANNLVIDHRKGGIKLIDFGCTKKIGRDGDENSTKTFCGTLHCMAPEILENVPYAYPVDWW